MAVRVTRSGPWFDGRAERAIEDFAREAEETIGNEGEKMLVARFGQVLKHPTGHYVSQLRVEQSKTMAEITDGGVIYGPWLESGPRGQNDPRKKYHPNFHGYFSFRTVRQGLQRRASRIATGILPGFLRRMQ
ncbi:hypothetical protein ACFO9E_18170 [Streptomyces maoxianensis]|uniref:HK97 gp10 family phage protein n=1 Tax=Streptomyces maoxianensis TaxID=1459942 RepID=A0ABV9G9E5_9ACTN